MFVVREVLESISKSKNMSQNSNYFYKNTSFFQNNISKVIIIRDNHDFKSCTKISIKKIWKNNNIFRLPYLTFFLVFNNLFNSSSVQKNTKLSSYSLCSKKNNFRKWNSISICLLFLQNVEHAERRGAPFDFFSEQNRGCAKVQLMCFSSKRCAKSWPKQQKRARTLICEIDLD